MRDFDIFVALFVGEDGHFGVLRKESENYHYNVEFFRRSDV